MATFVRCDDSVNQLADELMCKYPDHEALIEAKVRIDFVFAFAKRDEDTGDKLGPALKLHGVPCLGIARKISIKDRALGRGDAEISLDGDEWPKMSAERKAALLDHELHHLTVKRDRFGSPCTDDIDRPVIRMRPHDFQFGWFNVIAARHGAASFERLQAKQMMDDAGQFFWPEIFEPSR